MKHLKKVLAIVLTMAMLLSFASCSFANEDTMDITNDNIKIGVVLDGALDSASGNAGVCISAINQLTDLGYGIRGERFKYAENVAVNDAENFKKSVTSLINFECNLVILSDPAYMSNVKPIADAHKDVVFLVFNGENYGKNVFSYKANITGAAYLAGIAAGLKAMELKVPFIGFLLKSDRDLTTLNAFAEGAKSVYKDVKIEAKLSKDTAADAKALVTKGAVVLASDFEDEAVAKTASENNVYFCGFASASYSSSEDGKYDKAYLCAPVYNCTQIFVDVIKAIVDETEIKSAEGGLAAGYTYLSALGESAAKGTQEAVNKASEALISGTLKFPLSAGKPVAGVTLVK